VSKREGKCHARVLKRVIDILSFQSSSCSREVYVGVSEDDVVYGGTYGTAMEWLLGGREERDA
jgi:hypothetical protein